MTPELIKKIEELKKNEDICKIINLWIDEECKRLKNPDNWIPFSVGEGRVEAAKSLKRLSKQLIQTDIEVKKRISYL